nr:MAG TPA: hypothetical protein [Crassvirales sp.]
MWLLLTNTLLFCYFVKCFTYSKTTVRLMLLCI